MSTLRMIGKITIRNFNWILSNSLNWLNLLVIIKGKLNSIALLLDLVWPFNTITLERLMFLAVLHRHLTYPGLIAMQRDTLRVVSKQMSWHWRLQLHSLWTDLSSYGLQCMYNLTMTRTKFPMFSLSGKMNIQISCFPCTVATLCESQPLYCFADKFDLFLFESPLWKRPRHDFWIIVSTTRSKKWNKLIPLKYLLIGGVLAPSTPLPTSLI